MRHLRRGAVVGMGLGALFFAADLTGASLAVGFLFDPTLSQLALLALAALGCVLSGAAAGSLLGVAWPERWHLRRRWLWLLVATLGAATILAGYEGRVERRVVDLGPRPAVTVRPAPVSVLFVIIDTLRADALYGEGLRFPLAPNAGALAEHSVLFTDAEAAAGWTLPSVATLITGIHPERLYSARGFVPDWAPTLAERLRAAGYETHAIVDNGLLERRNGFAAAYETYFQRSAIRFAFTLPGFRLQPGAMWEAVREKLPVNGGSLYRELCTCRSSWTSPARCRPSAAASASSCPSASSTSCRRCSRRCASLPTLAATASPWTAARGSPSCAARRPRPSGRSSPRRATSAGASIAGRGGALAGHHLRPRPRSARALRSRRRPDRAARRARLARERTRSLGRPLRAVARGPGEGARPPAERE